MKYNKKATEAELDLAAKEFDEIGYTDLAEKVDYYNDRLSKASSGEIPLIRRALARIISDGKRRMNKEASESRDTEGEERAKKAEAATMKSRRSSDLRREVLHRRLQSVAAQRRRANKRLEVLRTKRMDHKQKTASRRQARKKRLEE